MKTKTIFKVLNKLVWDIIWFGFFTLLIVFLVAAPQMYYKFYSYTPEYRNNIDIYPIVDEYSIQGLNENEIIETTANDKRVVFIETISKRVDFLRYTMIIYFLLLILINFKDDIFNELPPHLKTKWETTERNYKKFLKRINW